jgi:hypothetical protein
LYSGHPKWGFIDKTGTLVIPFTFDDVAEDNYGGFEDPNSAQFLPKPFRNFSEGLCAVRIGDKWGYIDKTGKVVIPAEYDSAGTFSEGLACVRKGLKVGYVDKTGRVVIPIELDWFPNWQLKDPAEAGFSDAGKSFIQALQFSDGLAAAYKGANSGYIDKTGKFVIEPKWDRCSLFREGMGIVSKNFALSCIDRSGTVTLQLPPKTGLYGDGFFVQGLEPSKLVSTDKTGKQAIQGLEPAQLVYIDKTGKRAIQQVFTGATAFSEGLAAVETYAASGPLDPKENKAWGYIDKSGKMVIAPCCYVAGNNLASAFIDGRAIVSQLDFNPLAMRNLHGVLDRTGKWIVPPKYDHIAAYRDGLALAHKYNTSVFLNKEGVEVIDTHKPWANSFSDGMAAVMQP